MIPSVIIDKSIHYPSQEDFFSPDEAYPEYRFRHLSTRPNQVYRAVRQILAQAGLDAANFGTAEWNPLRQCIPEGSRVFVLCNFVYHRRDGEPDKVFWSKCTHGSVLRVLVDYLLLAVGPTGSVRFGNAPVQSCDWKRVLAETGAQQVSSFFQERMPEKVEACDLRSFIVKRGPLGELNELHREVDRHDEVEVDLGGDSLLEELYALGQMPKFRSLDYNPEQTEGFHDRGRHVYVINRRILEADVIFSVPKLKVHEKVGATLAVKGCVGGIAHKHCLAHFRLGSSHNGGDEFEGSRFLNRIESVLGEYLNAMPKSPAQNFLRSADFFLRKANLKFFRRSVGGGWAGNDTTWRMSMDIARILAHADSDGVLSKRAVRRHLSLIDGVLAGEGQGPLSPTAKHSGFLLFTEDVPAGDFVACCFMGIDPEKLPIVQRAFHLASYPLSTVPSTDVSALINGTVMTREELLGWQVETFAMPFDW